MVLLYYYVGVVSFLGIIFFAIMSIYSFINVEALKIKQGNNNKSGLLMLICSFIYALIGVISYLKIKRVNSTNINFTHVRKSSEESEKEFKEVKYQKHIDNDSNHHEIHLDQL